ncbi:hypothetical protein M9H77_18266 [Catharanthus roseus]|uniref:Uncharacterized protein n=1 Tax=Catharanthus roseus TaxID=4058 RepID=A0ACC0B703_CATRO|nr:hypothetical protein M9H77_18266 [Catharanthus roseus]
MTRHSEHGKDAGCEKVLFKSLSEQGQAKAYMNSMTLSTISEHIHLLVVEDLMICTIQKRKRWKETKTGRNRAVGNEQTDLPREILNPIQRTTIMRRHLILRLYDVDVQDIRTPVHKSGELELVEICSRNGIRDEDENNEDEEEVEWESNGEEEEEGFQ